MKNTTNVWDRLEEIRVKYQDDLYEVQKDVVENGTALDCIEFLKRRPSGANMVVDIRGLQERILEVGTVCDVRSLASSVPYANIPLLQERIERDGDARDLYMFGLQVDRADMKSLRARLVEIDSVGTYLNMFDRDFTDTCATQKDKAKKCRMTP